jgi:Tol biopolymer transport system component
MKSPFKKQPRQNWIILGVLALMLIVTAVHFGPRYLYSHFGDLVLGKVVGGLSQEQKQAVRAGTRGLKAKVVWSSSRSGNHELYMLTLPDMEFYRLTHNDRVEYYSRFSPDGKRLVFARSQRLWVSERYELPWDVWVMDLATRDETEVAKNGNYPQWVGNDQVSFMRGGQVVLKDLKSGQEKVLYDAAQPPVKGVPQTPELSPDRRLLAFTARGAMRGTVVYDLAANKLRQVGDGCEITWYPDSRRVLWVENGGNGGTQILHSALEPLKPQVLMDLPGKYSHEYFPRLSPDGKWLVWGAAAKGHEHDVADYEIFLWQLGTPWESALRLTQNQANDRWPDIFIEK